MSHLHKMLRTMIRHAAVCLIFAVSLDAFHIGMLPSTTTTTHGFIQSPKMLIPNHLMPVSRCVCCLSKKVVSGVLVPVPAVVAVYLGINVFLWTQIAGVSTNLNTKIDGVSTQINGNINEKFKDVAVTLEKINGRVSDYRAEVKYVEGSLKSPFYFPRDDVISEARACDFRAESKRVCVNFEPSFLVDVGLRRMYSERFVDHGHGIIPAFFPLKSRFMMYLLRGRVWYIIITHQQDLGSHLRSSCERSHAHHVLPCGCVDSGK